MPIRIAMLMMSLILGGCTNTSHKSEEKMFPQRKTLPVMALVEIPAGTTAKFEVEKATGTLVQDTRDGEPRFVNFLPYPSNYGMIPSTVLDEDAGGDGDPLDVLILGPALPRGDLVSVRLIGVLAMIDTGERDDKILAVPIAPSPRNPFGECKDLTELKEKYPEALKIIELWFTSYKGPGRVESLGWQDEGHAISILESARQQYRAQTVP